MNIHFLHIGKTGGSAIKITLGGKLGSYSIPLSSISPEYTSEDTLHFHPHKKKLRDIPLGEKFFFCVRDIYSRFCSAFYSRKRKGYPLYSAEWNTVEERVFTEFYTPESLVQGAIAGRDTALAAFQGIIHISRRLSFWFESVEYLDSRRNDILYILDQDNLSTDYIMLVSLLRVSDPKPLPVGDESIHKNIHCDHSLSDSSRAFLQGFYKDDLAILAYCNHIRNAEV